MRKHFFQKTLLVFFSFCLIITMTFFFMHMIPGDPFMEDQALPEEIQKALYQHFGLDKPLIIQFFHYLKGIFSFDLGPSLKHQGRSVNQIIAEGFPISFLLGLESLVLAISGGLLLGGVAAFFHLFWQDRVILILVVLGISFPGFLMATFLQYTFAMQLDLFPVARWETFGHTVLPAITLALFPLAYIARLVRVNLIEVLQQDYILTAKSKGLTVLKIFFKHTLRNALLPVVAYLGPLIASIVTGSFVVEKIFGIPGLGQWYVCSIINRDYTVIMGTTIFYSAILVVCLFFTDLLSGMIDPRMRRVCE